MCLNLPAHARPVSIVHSLSLTHTDVLMCTLPPPLSKAVLDFIRDSPTLDETKVYVMGFSQNSM